MSDIAVEAFVGTYVRGVAFIVCENRGSGATGREAFDSVAATAARLVKSSAETSASGFESVDIIVRGLSFRETSDQK